MCINLLNCFSSVILLLAFASYFISDCLWSAVFRSKRHEPSHHVKVAVHGRDLISVFNCLIYACLLLPTSPSCNSCCTKRTIFPWQRVLRTDPKENTSRLLLTGRCLATDRRKERIAPLLGRCHSNVPKKN
jgi:hypothetical protein